MSEEAPSTVPAATSPWLEVRTPVAGRVVGLAGVDDDVFAQAMVGPGTAVDPAPDATVAVAPVGGEIVTLHPHAFVVAVRENTAKGVLVHLGIDTVELHGEGFEPLVARGDRVDEGQPLIRWDPAGVAAGGRSPVCPVVALDAVAEQLDGVRASGDISRGDVLFRWS